MFFKDLPPHPAGCRACRSTTDDVPLIADLADLTYLVDLDGLEVHIPHRPSTTTAGERNPDRFVIDLDPGGRLGQCAKVALLLRERLATLGLELFPVTFGSKGVQLYAALGGDLSDQVRDLAMPLAQEMTGRRRLVLWKMTSRCGRKGLPRLTQRNITARRRSARTRFADRHLRCAHTEPGTRSKGAPATRPRSSA